jgi:hypothetical protein
MTALVKVLARAFPTDSFLNAAIVEQLALLCCAALFVSILSLTYGVDLSCGFFWRPISAATSKPRMARPRPIESASGAKLQFVVQLWPMLPAGFLSEQYAARSRVAVSSKIQGPRGVVKSLGDFACGPVVLIHTQEFQFQKNQKTHLSVPVLWRLFGCLRLS